MAYVNPDAKSGADLKRRVAAGEVFSVFQPGGLFPLTPDVVKGDKGYTVVEGPHYPKPHTYYVAVEYDLNTKHLTRVLTNAEQRKIYRG